MAEIGLRGHAVELQRQLSGQAYPYESGPRYPHEYRGMAYNQAGGVLPQPAGRSEEYVHMSHQLNSNLAMLAQQSHMLQQKRAPDIYPAAPKPYGVGGMGPSGGVPGRGLMSPAQGHEEASSRSHSGGNSGSGALDFSPPAPRPGLIRSYWFRDPVVYPSGGQAPLEHESVLSVPASDAGLEIYR